MDDHEQARPEERVRNALAESNALVRAGDSLVAQFLLNTAPWVGGVGAAASGLAAKRKEARLREFLLDVVKQLDHIDRSIADRIDRDFLESDEFAGLLESLTEEAGRSATAGRLSYLRSFLVNSSITPRPDATWIELFLQYLPRLSGQHLILLERFYSKQRNIPSSDRLGIHKLRNVPICFDAVSEGQGELLVRVALADLANLGLLVDWRYLSGEGEPQRCYTLSRNGKLFMRFIESDWTGGPSESAVD